MDASVAGRRLQGTVRIPSSKSYTHRAVIGAALSSGTTIRRALVSADTRATIRAVEAFGATVDRDDDAFTVTGIEGRPSVPADVLDCANSGTTLRLTTACAALADGTTVLTGDESLRSRPNGPLLAAIETLGGSAASTRGNGRAPLVVSGPLRGGTVGVPGSVSSQFVSALLLAGSATDDGIAVGVEGELVAAPYVDLTLDFLSSFGVDGCRTSDGYAADGGGLTAPETYTVPGDMSSLSYPLAAGAIAGEDVRIEGATPGVQGDSAIVDIVARMGASVDWDREAGVVTVSAAPLSGVTVDVADTPDLLPTIATLGAVADGETRIENCEAVRHKETDRVSVMASELREMGAVVHEEPATLVVDGDASTLAGTTVDGHRDHRVVMALAVAALGADGRTTIVGADHVDVSYPRFFQDVASLGADVRTT